MWGLALRDWLGSTLTPFRHKISGCLLTTDTLSVNTFRIRLPPSASNFPSHSRSLPQDPGGNLWGRRLSNGYLSPGAPQDLSELSIAPAQKYLEMGYVYSHARACITLKFYGHQYYYLFAWIYVWYIFGFISDRFKTTKAEYSPPFVHEGTLGIVGSLSGESCQVNTPRRM